MMFSAIALLGFVSAPIGGRLADSIGRTPVIAFGSAASAFSIGALPWARGRAAFYALLTGLRTLLICITLFFLLSPPSVRSPLLFRLRSLLLSSLVCALSSSPPLHD